MMYLNPVCGRGIFVPDALCQWLYQQSREEQHARLVLSTVVCGTLVLATLKHASVNCTKQVISFLDISCMKKSATVSWIACHTSAVEG